MMPLADPSSEWYLVHDAATLTALPSRLAQCAGCSHRSTDHVLHHMHLSSQR